MATAESPAAPRAALAQYVSLAAAARIAGAYPMTVKRWAAERRVRTLNMPGMRRRYNSADLLRLVEASTTAGPDGE